MGQDQQLIPNSEIDNAWRVVHQLRQLALTLGVENNKDHFLNKAAGWLENALQTDDVCE